MSDDVRWLDDEEQAAWRRFVSGSTVFFRELERRLLEGYDLSADDYAILVLLSEAPDRRVRMSELASSAILPRPQVTYRVTRLENRGIVVRRPCETDARGTFAELTDDGFALLTEAARHHVRNVRALLLDHLDRGEFLAAGAALGKVYEAIAPDETPTAQRA